MPVKRRVAKRRIDAEREYTIWQSILTSGVDFFDELPALGLAPIDKYRTPPLVEARLAWRRLGARVLAELRPGDPEPWAQREFGEP